MNMQVYDNIDFQRKNFPEIFKGYTNIKEADSEVAVSIAQQEEISENIVKDEIVILCESFEEILVNALNLPYEIKSELTDEFEDYEIICINNSYLEKEPKRYHSKKLMELYYTHGYNTKFYKISLVKKIHRHQLKRAAVVIILKELDFYDKMALKEINYLQATSNSVQELREILLRFKCYYNEKTFTLNEFSSKSKKDNIYTNNLIEGSYSAFLSLEICTYLSSRLVDKSIDDSEYYKVVDMCINEFSKEAKEILEKFIVSPDFTKNYIIVEIYLSISQKVVKDITKYVLEIFKKEVKGILNKATSSTDIYLALLDSSITEVDNLLKEKIEELYSIITSTLGKVS